MIKRFTRLIKTSQSVYTAKIEKKGSEETNQQCSYNLEIEMESYLLSLNAIQRITPPGNNTNVLYKISYPYRIVLGENIYAVIGDSFKRREHKAIFTHTEGENGTSKKIQFKRTDFKKQKNPSYEWFVELYNKNIDYVNFITIVDDDNKTITFDLELSKELFNPDRIQNKEEDEDEVFEMSDADTMKLLFVNWLEKQGKATSYIKGHLTHLNMLSRLIEKNIYSIETVEEVMDLYERIKNEPELKQKDDATHNHYSAATKAYANFLSDYLNNGGIKASKYSAEWFKAKASEFDEVGNEANLMRQNFVEKYGVDKLKARQGEELLNFLFLGGNEDNLCHELEYAKRNRELFGSVKSGTAFKYPLFKRDGVWVTGSSRKPKSLTLAEAIVLGTSVRDQIVKAVEEINNSLPINTIEDYLNLYTKLYAIMPELVDSLWVIKYLHMLFPELLPVFYNKDWQVKVLTIIDIVPSETLYGRLGQIALFVAECGISNVIFAQIFHKYCRVVEIEEEDETDLDNCDRVTGGTNIILYGVPGAGKSWTIKEEYCDDESRMERLVFHPDYTYSDFVGQIMPIVNEDGSVSYAFNPGPFTKLMKKAYNNPDEVFYLVIEEVNRGNAPAIFGDVFQLLDRNKDGASEYAITNADIAKVVYDKENHKVSIPSNLSILCTMNTSDQNVFTLDTAFQRRWNMRLIQNKFRVGEEKEQEFAKTEILDTTVRWEKFFTEINKIILDKNIRMTSSEDKRLGTHFVSVEDLKYEEGNNKQNSKFPEKVLKYLWDDAFKFTKEDVFDLEKVKSLEDVIELFLAARGSERFRIFKENIFNTIVVKANPETENTDNN